MKKPEALLRSYQASDTCKMDPGTVEAVFCTDIQSIFMVIPWGGINDKSLKCSVMYKTVCKEPSPLVLATELTYVRAVFGVQL